MTIVSKSDAEVIRDAQAALDQGDLDEVLAHCANLRGRDTANRAAHTLAIHALSGHGRFDEADTLLEAAAELFPADLNIAIMHAQNANRLDAWAVAEYRWVLASLRFPDEPQVLIGFADMLAQQQQWAKAIDLWRIVCDRVRKFPPAFIHLSECYRHAGRLAEADAALVRGAAAFPDDAAIHAQHARLADVMRDWNESARRWNVVKARFPEVPEAPICEALALAQLWRFDDAEKVLSDAIAIAPPDRIFDLRREQAWLGIRKRDPDYAKSRFDAMIRDYPDQAAGYAGAALALGGFGREAEAEALLNLATERLPLDRGLAFQRIELAMAFGRTDFDAAERATGYLKEFRARFSDDPVGFVLGAQLHVRDNHYDEAAALLTAGLAKWPDHPDLLLQHARCAELQGDSDVAEQRYRMMTHAQPLHPDGYLGQARLLDQLGSREAAEAVLRAAMSKLPGVQPLPVAYATIAGKHHDWQAAVQRWTDVVRQFPNDEAIARGLFEARLALVGSETPSEPAADEVSDLHYQAGAGEPPTVVELAMHFESLGGGDGQGCEFGMFQRALGAEPLGLLRWTSLEPAEVVAALRARFEGVGDPEQTVIDKLTWPDHEEYVTSDVKYGMHMHSFIKTSTMTEQQAAQMLGRRLKFLTREFIEDVTAGDKIFVYRKVTRDLEASEIDEMHAAMRSYGNNMMLYVRYEDGTHPNGTVSLVRPGLMIGYIDRFAFSRDMQRTGAANESWLRICQNAYRLWQEHRAEVDG
jgi:predicted Zn-dependent protease